MMVKRVKHWCLVWSFELCITCDVIIDENGVGIGQGKQDRLSSDKLRGYVCP
jgi:hypothetical protein